MSLNKILKPLSIGALFLFPVACILPHGGSSVFFSFAAFGLIISWLEWREISKAEKQAFLAILLLAAVPCLFLIHSQDMRDGFKKLERLIRILLVIPVYVLLRSLGHGLGGVYLKGVIFCTAVLLAVGIFQSVNSDLRASGGYNPIVFGCLGVLTGTVLVGALLSLGFANRGLASAFVLGIGASGYTIFLSGTRGLLAIVPVLIVVSLVISAKRYGRKAALRLAAFAMLFSVFLYGIAPKIMKRRISTVAYEMTQGPSDIMKVKSLGSRLRTWQGSLEMILKTPLFGAGLGDFHLGNRRLIARGELHGKAFAGAHNLYLDILARMGLVGFLMMTSILFLIPGLIFYKTSVQYEGEALRFYSLSGLLTVISFAVIGITNVWIWRMPLITIYLITLAVFLSSIVSERFRLQKMHAS